MSLVIMSPSFVAGVGVLEESSQSSRRNRDTSIDVILWAQGQ